MTAHEEYTTSRQLEGYTYDEADDGPEVGAINFFLLQRAYYVLNEED